MTTPTPQYAYAAYYNEIDPYAAAWLRNLIAAGLLPPGDVDERSIADVRSGDLADYTQCHFFAGIGGWAYALRLTGWPDDRPVWTGSCPCQPFSAAGKRKGTADERHLWPEFRRLIADCRPSTVFGEQVASKDGRLWLFGIRADLEELGYGVGAADLCAAGVGAPHIRQRLWWVADADGDLQPGWEHGQQPKDGRTGRLEHAKGDGWQQRRPEPGRWGAVGGCCEGWMGNSDQPRSQGRGLDAGEHPDQRLAGPAGAAGFWTNAEWLPCTDGKARRVEPGLQPLAHGVPNRVGRLRAYGNAIVPQVAAEFIRAWEAA